MKWKKDASDIHKAKNQVMRYLMSVPLSGLIPLFFYNPEYKGLFILLAAFTPTCLLMLLSYKIRSTTTCPNCGKRFYSLRSGFVLNDECQSCGYSAYEENV